MDKRKESFIQEKKSITEHSHGKRYLITYANKDGPDQPVYMRSLITTLKIYLIYIVERIDGQRGP